mmetsp:Transcript_13083/g.37308  ORF Transcript_13083/g.37308 Transcript_13083/m.37308 type:complete len:377 (-) Transcript_13083:2132-3262(-)
MGPISALAELFHVKASGFKHLPASCVNPCSSNSPGLDDGHNLPAIRCHDLPTLDLHEATDLRLVLSPRSFKDCAWQDGRDMLGATSEFQEHATRGTQQREEPAVHYPKHRLEGLFGAAPSRKIDFRTGLRVGAGAGTLLLFFLAACGGPLVIRPQAPRKSAREKNSSATCRPGRRHGGAAARRGSVGHAGRGAAAPCAELASLPAGGRLRQTARPPSPGLKTRPRPSARPRRGCPTPEAAARPPRPRPQDRPPPGSGAASRRRASRRAGRPRGPASPRPRPPGRRPRGARPGGPRRAAARRGGAAAPRRPCRSHAPGPHPPAPPSSPRGGPRRCLAPRPPPARPPRGPPHRAAPAGLFRGVLVGTMHGTRALHQYD